MELKNGLKRILTSLAGMAFFLLAIYIGKAAILIVTTIIFLFSIFEIISLLKGKKEVGFPYYIIAFIYVALIFSVNLTVALTYGRILLLYTLVGTWVFDILAYYVGSNWGKHKITPAISPSKSYEGFIAGFLGVMLIGLLFPDFILSGKNPAVYKTIWVALIAVGSFIGDLVESYFKRKIKVKDSSKLIPGHGGFLDRFDSLIMSSTLSYLFYRFFM